MLSKGEISKNQRAFDHAIAQQTLEGLAIPQEVLADMKKAVRGEIPPSDIIRNIYRQFPDVEIFQP